MRLEKMIRQKRTYNGSPDRQVLPNKFKLEYLENMEKILNKNSNVLYQKRRGSTRHDKVGR